MSKNDFYMVLPSNSSMDYYPDNVASRYTTLLPKQIELTGEWMVGLSEIQFPCNFLHLREDHDGESCVFFGLHNNNKVPSVKPIGEENLVASTSVNTPDLTVFLESAVFGSTSALISLLNSSELHYHFDFEYRPETGYVKVSRACKEPYAKNCKGRGHSLKLSDKLWTMLGFRTGTHQFPEAASTKSGERPASLSRGLPGDLYVYCDLCTPYVTGDVQSSLLRVVPFNSAAYAFGATHCVTFHTPHYIPLIRSSVRTIEIDIRSHRGELIPFEYGPLNVTLHFKRVD